MTKSKEKRREPVFNDLADPEKAWRMARKVAARLLRGERRYQDIDDMTAEPEDLAELWNALVRVGAVRDQAIQMSAEARDERCRLRGRLAEIVEVIEEVDRRAMAADGPVTPTLQEMRQDEMSRIYELAKGDSGSGEPDGDVPREPRCAVCGLTDEEHGDPQCRGPGGR